MPSLRVCGRGPTPELPLDESAAATTAERPVALLVRPRRRSRRRAEQLALALPVRRGRPEVN